MRIKTITAPNMADALRIIRTQLGPEALILGTRKVKNAQGEPTLEITAALNEPDEADLAPSASAPIPSVQPPAATPLLASMADASPSKTASASASKPINKETENLARLLAAHSLPADLAERLITALPALQQAGFSVAEGLDMLLGKMLPLQTPAQLLPRGQVHVFVGPSGAGKTTLIAKLAVQARQSGTTVGLLSLDDQKIAGFEPLAVAAEALGDDAFLIRTPADLTAAAKKMGPRQLMLIDTPGLNPYQKAGHINLQRRLKELNIPHRVHLVAPAYLHGPALAMLPVAFQSLGPSTLLFTKLDETTHFGPMVTALAAHKLSGGLITNHPSYAQPPQPLTGQWLAEVLTLPPRQPGAEF